MKQVTLKTNMTYVLNGTYYAEPILVLYFLRKSEIASIGEIESRVEVGAIKDKMEDRG